VPTCIPPDVVRLFAAYDFAARIDRITKRVRRLNGEDAEYRAEQLSRRVKNLLPPPPLAPAQRQRIVKRLSGRAYRPGFARSDASLTQLELTPSTSNLGLVNEFERSVFCVISEGVADRVGDVVQPGGINFDNYAMNPIVLLNHNNEALPIGTTRDPKTRQCTVQYDRANNRVTAKIYFAQGVEPAEQVWSLVRQGVLRAVSIGFSPLATPRSLPSGGSEFPAVELLELSVVNVPALPSALMTSEQKKRAVFIGV
jgi:phage head maturation protease